MLAGLIVLLLAAPGTLAWSQFHGGPDRNERPSLPGGPLDVVRTLQTGGNFTNTFWGTRAVPVPEGLALLQDSDAGCDLVIVAPPYERVTRRMSIDGCNFGLLIGYDEVKGAVLVCDNASENDDVMKAVDVRTGERLWNVAPGRDLNPVVGSVRWLCLGAAIDTVERVFGVGIEVYGSTGSYGVDHIIAMGDLGTGRLLWRGDLPVQEGSIPINTGVQPETYPRSIHPRGVTLTSTGLVVTGYLGCGPAVAVGVTTGCLESGFVGWFTRAGDFRGYKAPEPLQAPDANVATAAARSRAVSQYAVASGPIAALGLGTEAIVINPEAPELVLRAPLEGVEPTSRSTFWFPGAWTSELILIPIFSSVTALDPVSLAPAWSFTEGLEWRIVDSLTTTAGETYVLLTKLSGEEHRLVVLETSSGEVLRRLPIAAHVRDEDRRGGWYAHQIPVPEGIAIVDLYGQIHVLAQAEPAKLPRVSVSEDYPAPGQAFTLTVLPAAPSDLIVGWGNGEEERIENATTVRHVFAERGPRDITVTSVFADGTTATRVVTVHVGGTPPPELTALQRALSPDNQEVTFFVLGTLITVVAFAVTIGRHRRRFTRLEQELAAVEEIRLLSTSDPKGAVQALKAYRERLPGDLARRRIDDSQYQILDLRSARLLKVLRTRMFAPYDTRLSIRYHRLLDAAFEDAILQPSEREALVVALDQEEALRAEDRGEIVRLLDEFTSHNVTAALR